MEAYVWVDYNLRQMRKGALVMEWADVFLHMVLEALGGIAVLVARRWCRHLWHQAVVYILALFVFSLATVNLIG
jgi:hypothetical protein